MQRKSPHDSPTERPNVPVTNVNRTKVIGYIRVSTAHQAEEGVSLEAQKQRLGTYAELFHLDLQDIIVDAGQSAKTLQRPGLQQALAQLTTHQVQALLITKLDRLTRSVKDLSQLLETYFTANNAGLISVAENIDTTSAAGRLVLNVLVSVGQWEREAIGERTREALKHLSNSGTRLGQPPLGYEYTTHDHQRIRQPIDREQQILARIQQLRTSGFTIRAIAKTLTQEGYRTKRGFTTWSTSSIHRVLRRG